MINSANLPEERGEAQLQAVRRVGEGNDEDDGLSELRVFAAREDLTDEQRVALAHSVAQLEQLQSEIAPAEVYLSAVRELVGLFDETSLDLDDSSEPRLLVACGWWISTNRGARAVATLFEAGQGHEAAPIIRSMMEFAYSLQLAARLKGSRLNSLERATGVTFGRIIEEARSGVIEVTALEEVQQAFKVETESSQDWPDTFYGVLQELKVFADTYPIYRQLSLTSHASLLSALNFGSFGGPLLTPMRKQPVWDLSRPSISWAADCLCLAGLAFDSMLPRGLPFRDRLLVLTDELRVALPSEPEGDAEEGRDVPVA